MSEFEFTMRVRSVDGEPVIDHADDAIQVTGELAESFGVKPPLNGRITFYPGYVYDLSDWVGVYDDSRPGRVAGTYVGRRVHDGRESREAGA